MFRMFSSLTLGVVLLISGVWLHAACVDAFRAHVREGYVQQTQLAAMTAQRDALLGRVTRAELANSALRSDLLQADQEAALAAERIAAHEAETVLPDVCRVSVDLVDRLQSD